MEDGIERVGGDGSERRMAGWKMGWGAWWDEVTGKKWAGSLVMVVNLDPARRIACDTNLVLLTVL
ncbi:hypothetical protein IMZ48_17350 [Candidatus Bathyarchaeota archaeon]|nr:hypothetical protein [Candidatus Bathyarchaeota archaeon]